VSHWQWAFHWHYIKNNSHTKKNIVQDMQKHNTQKQLDKTPTALLETWAKKAVLKGIALKVNSVSGKIKTTIKYNLKIKHSWYKNNQNLKLMQKHQIRVKSSLCLTDRKDHLTRQRQLKQ
jgi:hypothetical protein